jgi:3-dehydroquinate dehydratase-1
MRQKNKPELFPVVGIVDSPESLAVAARLRRGDVDFLEWRADCLPRGQRIPKGRIPWIVTVRHPNEGGGRSWSDLERADVFRELIPSAALLDIELRSLPVLGCIRDAARAAGLPVVASFHDFKATPSVRRLRDLSRKARDEGAEIFKVATQTGSAADIVRLLGLFDSPPLPVAVMGMGPLGFGSRLLFAQCGSALNYGCLHRPNVFGQWSALELKRILS